MINIKNFQSAVARVGDRNAAFNLTVDKSGLRDTGNGIVRWVRSMNTSRNREASRLFIDALRQSYGEQIASRVIDTLSWNTRLEQGKPLRSRNIREALDLAEEIKNRFIKSNEGIASNYNRPLASGSDTSLLQIKFDHIAERLFGSDAAEIASIKAQVDFGDLGQKIKEEVNFSGKSGLRFVTSAEADKLAESVILKQATQAYRAILMDRIGITKTDSLSQQLLEKMNFDSATGLVVDLSKLEDNIVQEIDRQLMDKLSDAVYRKLNKVKSQGLGLGPSVANEEGTQSGLTIAVSSEDLKTMVDDVVGKFASERFAAGQAAQQLPVDDPGVKARMMQQILHSNMPASMVPAFGKAYPQLSEHFLKLDKEPKLSLLDKVKEQLEPGHFLQSGAELGLSQQEWENALIGVHDAVMNAMSDQNLSVENRDSVMRTFWQVFLTGCDDAQLRDISNQMDREGSPLRSFGEGAHYARYIFTQSNTFQKNESVYQSSVETAGEYDFLLNNLAQLLQDKAGISRPLVGVSSREMLSDDTIKTLRNAGIELPAPNRVGAANDNVRLSNRVLEKIQADLLSQARTNKTVTDDGVLGEFTRDLGRATYRLQGKDLGADSQGIINQLREFCTDESGKLNEEMLLKISEFAYQATAGMLMSNIAPGRERMSPFQFVPLTDNRHPSARIEYDIDKNAQGDISIGMKFFGPATVLNGIDLETKEDVDILLDQDTSYFRMAMDISLDAQTLEPVLDKASMGYAFYPQES